MQSMIRSLAAGLLALNLATSSSAETTLTIELTNGQAVKAVGVIDRWDQDGNHRTPPDKDAKIDAPAFDARARDAGNGKWVFEKLKPGRYDVVLLGDKLRIDGFTFVPVREFDPFVKSDAQPDEEAAEWIIEDIKASKHYENKVEPLYLAGNDKVVRVLVMLIRDKPTSYTPGAGTMRHEMWQYSWNYGGWQKERRTKVFDRVLMQVSEMRQWTWLWDPKLGGIEVKKEPVTIKYDVPKSAERKLKGLYPY